MINLFDSYHQESKDLHLSLQEAGYNHPTVVIHDDGFLPQNVTSPYAYFMGEETGRSRHFNKIEVPEYWEIAGNGEFGEILNMEERQAEIVYAHPKQKRIVREVKWLDRTGEVRWVDHYNQYGRRFAQTIYNLNREPIVTSYFKADGQEVIVENYVTQDIILNLDHQMKIFHSKRDFTIFFLRHAGYELDHIFYNSLSTPFFISHVLQEKGEDILFWQEKGHREIPGNMETILDGETSRTHQVVIQDRQVYQTFQSLAKEEARNHFHYLGYAYPFKQENPMNNDLFILTNSDQIEQLDVLIEALPFATIHIGALTEMSPSLMSREKYGHIRLYPRIEEEQIQQLLKRSSVYLDINHHGEVLSIVRQAFEHNLLILGFEETVHHVEMMSRDFIFPSEKVEQLLEVLTEALTSREQLDSFLNIQREAANYSSVADYQKRMDEWIGS